MLTSFEPPPRSLPFRFGTPEQFAALRAMLARLGYVERAVYARLAEMEEAEARADSAGAGGAGVARRNDRLDLLLDLFRGAPVERRALERELAKGDLEALEALALIEPTTPDEGIVRTTVLLYPVGSVYVVSDLQHHAGDTATPADTVYPAITRNTQHFLHLLPRRPCERLLELCSGTGIAALTASRFAGHAWAVDITERATRFAQFNVLLNGFENVTALQGDLYEPVSDRTFDRIVAHPPYVPAARQDFIFRDGGHDGEAITRRIIAGLPRHLEPGGHAYVFCLATDRQDAPLEHRVRTMLGSESEEFDVIIAERWAMSPRDYYARRALDGESAYREALDRRSVLEGVGVAQLVYGLIALQRIEAPRQVFTVRHQVSPATDATALDWLLQWHAMAMAGDGADRLLDEKPIAAPRVEVRVVHRESDGHWQAERCSVAARYPFEAEADCSVWVPQFMARCDGTTTVREHLRLLKEDGVVRGQASDADFAGFVKNFLDAGFLQLERCRIPATGHAR